jgi:hypothetical protein
MEELLQQLEEDHPVEKIPDSALLKISRQEVGALTSFIQELEHKISFLENIIKEKERLTHEENKEFKREKFYKELNEKIIARDKTVHDLRKQNEKLLCDKLKNCIICLESRNKKSN